MARMDNLDRRIQLAIEQARAVMPNPTTIEEERDLQRQRSEEQEEQEAAQAEEEMREIGRLTVIAADLVEQTGAAGAKEIHFPSEGSLGKKALVILKKELNIRRVPFVQSSYGYDTDMLSAYLSARRGLIIYDPSSGSRNPGITRRYLVGRNSFRGRGLEHLHRVQNNPQNYINFIASYVVRNSLEVPRL